MLERYHGKPMPGANQVISGGGIKLQVSNLMKSPFAFKKYGQSGIEVSDLFPKLGECVDDICVLRSMYTDIPNHPPGLCMMNTGHNVAGRPSLGSWLTYGLGTENQNLPGFVVLCPGIPIMGPQLWSSAFLPATYQGTWVQNNESDPEKLIPYLRGRSTGRPEQRRQLDLLGKLNRLQLSREEPFLQKGRDHNRYAFSMLLAGGGVKGGMIYGATDDFGLKVVDKPIHPHDLHATILYLCGFDHTKLTYRYSGRDFRLTDVGGKVIKDILA